jgi:hypothetical protein
LQWRKYGKPSRAFGTVAETADDRPPVLARSDSIE